MGWLPWMLIYFAGMIALCIWAYAHNARKQRQTLATRIHDGILSFEPIDGGSGVIATADIVEVVFVSTLTEEGGYEIVTRHGARILLRPKGWLHFTVLKEALQRSNPAIRSGERENCCHQCGSDLRLRRDVCPHCSEPIPQLVGHI